jgi:hypothetical protein
VVPFLGAQAPNDCEVFHLLSQFRQVLRDANSRYGGRNLLELTAVFMAGLEIKRIDLAGASVHPEEDAMPPITPLHLQAIGNGTPPSTSGHTKRGNAQRLHEPASSHHVHSRELRK